MSNIFTIQPKPVTITRYVVELDEAQARAILVDATEFQKELRIALADGRSTKAPSITLHRNGHRRPKVKHVKAERDRKVIVREPCENCGVSIAAYRQGKHKCKSAALAALAAKS